MSGYYTVNEMYGEKFYQVPKVFFTNPLYKKGLSPLEKMAFGMLKDRFSLSVKNGWYDDQGKIYFIFTQENLMEIFDCSNKTASNIKKNLIKVGLLEVKKRGQGKADYLYLKKPIVTENDIYEIDKQENSENNPPQTVGAVETCKKYTSKNVKSTRLDVSKVHANDTDSIDTDSIDTDIKNLNPNHVMDILWNLDLPMNLKQKIKIKVIENNIPFTSNHLLDIEHAYRYQIDKGLVIPTAENNQDGLNDIEFTDTIIALLENMDIKQIGSMKAIIDSWTTKAFQYKFDKIRNLIG